MSDWKTELVDIAENRLQITYTDELILQTAPTRTLIGVGCRLEHGVIAGNDADGWTKRLMRIGVADYGWVYVHEGISGTSTSGVRKVPDADLGKAQWTLEMQDATYFPIKSVEQLPTALHLTQYDVGQAVVFTHAEVMGRTGTVLAVSGPVEPDLDPAKVGELIVRVQMKDGSPIEVLQKSVAALVQDNEFEDAVSVGLKYPAGSKVWVKHHVRAGQPYAWRPAVSTGWKDGLLGVTFLDDGGQGHILRAMLAPGNEPAPQVMQLAPRADGRNAVPKGKRAKRWNVPKA